MLGWASIWWLGGALAAIPLIWWLHRREPRQAPRMVSAAFLWTPEDDDRRDKAPSGAADPVWWLRAVIATGLLVALAGPIWRTLEPRPITVWMDDSRTMRTREAGSVRAARAVDALAAALGNAEAGRITVRSLASPGRSLDLSGMGDGAVRGALADWYAVRDAPPRLPSVARLADASRHWLVSDGASAAFDGWTQGARFDRIIAVGAATENAGIARLSLRRALGDRRLFTGAVTITNAGARSVTRELVVRAGAAVVLRETLTLPPGQSRHRAFRLGAGAAGPVMASISPGDALAGDDRLVLSTQALGAVAVRMTGDCGRPVRAAVTAHPGLALLTAQAAPLIRPGLLIACGPVRPEPRGPTLWLRQAGESFAVRAPPRWRSSATALSHLILSRGALRRMAAPDADAGLETLLAAGDTPLILAAPPPNALVEVRLDLSSAPLVDQPEFSALFAGLVAQVLGFDPLAGYVATGKGKSALRIAPRRLAARTTPAAATSVTAARELGPWAIVFVLAIFLVDGLLPAWRRRRGEGRETV